MSTRNMPARDFSISQSIFLGVSIIFQAVNRVSSDVGPTIYNMRDHVRNRTTKYECGETTILVQSVGNLTSPGFPENLHYGICLCNWGLKGEDGYQVTVAFVTFDLPYADADGHCSRGFVSYGGYDYKGREVSEGRFCGTSRPPPFYADMRGAWIQLILTHFTESDDPIFGRHKGFRVVYKAIGSGSVSRLVVIVATGVLIPLVCCCPAVWFIRKRRKTKNDDLANIRIEARRHTREMRAALERLGVLGNKNSPFEDVREKSANKAQNPAHSPPAQQRETFKPYAASAPRSISPAVVHHPVATEPTTGWPLLPSTSYPYVTSPYQLATRYTSAKYRRCKMALAFRTPSMGSISEMEEMWDRSELVDSQEESSPQSVISHEVSDRPGFEEQIFV